MSPTISRGGSDRGHETLKTCTRVHQNKYEIVYLTSCCGIPAVRASGTAYLYAISSRRFKDRNHTSRFSNRHGRFVIITPNRHRRRATTVSLLFIFTDNVRSRAGLNANSFVLLFHVYCEVRTRLYASRPASTRKIQPSNLTI